MLHIDKEMSISKALQKIYNSTLPTFNFWQQTETHLQPTSNPYDSIPSYGVPADKYYYDYDGVYKPRYPANPTKNRTDNIPRSALARATIDDYGELMTTRSINDRTSGLEYVDSEIQVAKKNGRKIAGYDSYYPVRDPIRSDFPVTSGQREYDGKVEYDFNSKLWSTRDITTADNYPPKLDRLDFSKRINLYDPELAGQTSGADAWQHEGARDEYDPVEDTFILTSKELFSKRTGIYRKPLTEEERYKNMSESYDVHNRAIMNDYLQNKVTHNFADTREDYFHPGIDYVSLEQARHGFTKNKNIPARPLTSAQIIKEGARRSWEDIQNEKTFANECRNEYPIEQNRANPWS